MLHKYPHQDNQAQFFFEINILKGKLPASHPIQTVHAMMRGARVKGFPGAVPKEIGYHSGLWGVFVPTRLLYIEILSSMRPIGENLKQFKDILLPLGYRFHVTDNFAEAVLLVMKELGITDEQLERNMRISERQIDGTHKLMRMHKIRVAKRAKRERLKDKDESTRRRAGDIS